MKKTMIIKRITLTITVMFTLGTITLEGMQQNPFSSFPSQPGIPELPEMPGTLDQAPGFNPEQPDKKQDKKQQKKQQKDILEKEKEEAYEKSPGMLTDEDEPLDDFFAKILKKKEPKETKKHEEKVTKPKAKPFTSRINQDEKDIDAIGKEITDLSKELSKFPATEPMKKRIDELKKEEEKKTKDAEEFRKKQQKASPSRYRAPSESGGRRRGGRESDWSPWGGSGSGSSGGTSPFGDGSSMTEPTSSFGEMGGDKKLSTPTATPAATDIKGAGGTVASNDEALKTANKTYLDAVSLYKTALSSMESLTEAKEKSPEKLTQDFINRAAECHPIGEQIKSAKAIKDGMLKEYLTLLEKQHKNALTDLEKKVNGLLTGRMFDVALDAATKLDKDANPLGQSNQKQIADFIKNSIKPLTPPGYDGKVKAKETALLDQVKNKKNYNNIIRDIKVLTTLKPSTITVGYTRGENVDGNVFAKITAHNLNAEKLPLKAVLDRQWETYKKFEESLKDIKHLIPSEAKDFNNLIDEYNSQNQKLDVKKALLQFNIDNQTASGPKSKATYQGLIDSFKELTKDLKAMGHQKEAEIRLELLTKELGATPNP